MRFQLNLPPFQIRGPRPEPQALAQLVVEKLLPRFAKQLEPLLPPAAPAHRVLSLRERDPAGKGHLPCGVSGRPDARRRSAAARPGNGAVDGCRLREGHP